MDDEKPDVYPPKVVTINDLQAFLPWAAIEANPDGELVIYTGLQHTDKGVEAPLAFIDGMGV
jgi:hypothetical protein